jgi:ABC-type antimicrobial peptide transport system permease subunit
VINRALAEHFWPGENPIGREANVNGRFPCTVIGVVADVRHGGPEVPAGNEMYVSMYQVGDAISWDLMVRTSLPVTALTAGLRETMRDIDAGLPLSKARPMQVLVDRTLSSRRLLVWLIGGFAAIAVGLAALGLYGVISYGVTQRTREIGIRLALGAEASAIRWQVVGRTIQLAGGGLALGLLASVLVSRWLRSLLFELTPIDGATYLVVTMALLVCAGLAGYLPARRASSVDPLVSLRAE